MGCPFRFGTRDAAVDKVVSVPFFVSCSISTSLAARLLGWGDIYVLSVHRFHTVSSRLTFVF